MRRRTYLATLGAALGTGAFGSAAGRDYRPGGPWSPTENSINYSAYHTNEELTEELRKIDRQSDRVELREIGRSSGRGDPLWEVTLGDGDTSVHLINQIHGDEPIGTEAVLKILRQLATGSSRQVEEILSELTLTVVARANPDGANFVGADGLGDDGEFRHRRTNTTEWQEGDSRHRPYYFYDFLEVGGYDMNRDFNIRPDFEATTDDEPEWWTESDGLWYMDMPYEGEVLESSGLLLNPETRAITRSFLEADPDFCITHHHQGPALVPDSGENGPDQQTIMSVMSPYGPAYADNVSWVDEGNPFLSEDAQRRSLQMSVLVKDALARGNSVFDTITRYPYLPLWGSYLDCLCPQTDAAGILYEVCHQSDDRGHKAYGQMAEATKVGFMETFERLADGSIHGIDEMRYFDEMSPRDTDIENPHGGRAPR